MMNKALVVLFIIIFPVSCSLDYSDADLAESLSSETPDMVIFGYSSVDVHNGSPTLKVKAEKASFYNSKDETVLSKVEFFNYKDNDLSSHGKTDNAVLNMKSDDASLQGSILVESAEDNSFLKAESLHWVDKEKKLTSDDKDSVTVQDKDGSRLEGVGFSADIKRNTIKFDKEISGEINSN